MVLPIAVVLDYTNREGLRNTKFGIGGCPIDRHHYSEKDMEVSGSEW